MAEALILDSEAVNALANPGARGALRLRCRGVLELALERRALVRVPAPVLAEVCRGGRFDAAVDHLLAHGGVAVVSLTRRTAQRAGALLTRARLDSRHAVDAFVVATALEFESAIIATGDRSDLQRLVGDAAQVRLLGL